MVESSLKGHFPQKHYFSSIWVCGSCGLNAKAICLNKRWCCKGERWENLALLCCV